MKSLSFFKFTLTATLSLYFLNLSIFILLYPLEFKFLFDLKIYNSFINFNFNNLLKNIRPDSIKILLLPNLKILLRSFRKSFLFSSLLILIILHFFFFSIFIFLILFDFVKI